MPVGSLLSGTPPGGRSLPCCVSSLMILLRPGSPSEGGTGALPPRFRSRPDGPTGRLRTMERSDMENRSKVANYILAGLAAIVVVAGAIGYQMTQEGQPTPTSESAAPADQKPQ